jgi:NAD(P)-dependent dehydrogenase (short-subunit alcohol dehydrogenase family)
VNRLSGRRVLVIGGAKGIGAAIVHAFVADGAVVAVLDRDARDVAAISDTVDGRAWSVDLDDVRDVRDCMEKATARLGRLDVLVNNLGNGRFASLFDWEPAESGEVFRMPTQTMLVTTQAAVRAMVAFRTPSAECAGKVINVAGVGGSATGGQTHYAAAKASVMALTRAAAHELGPHGITVNCLCPGYVLDEMEASSRTPSGVASLSALSPLGRLADSQDIARAALFLASSDSDYLTGDALNVAGGMALH